MPLCGRAVVKSLPRRTTASGRGRMDGSHDPTSRPAPPSDISSCGLLTTFHFFQLKRHGRDERGTYLLYGPLGGADRAVVDRVKPWTCRCADEPTSRCCAGRRRADGEGWVDATIQRVLLHRCHLRISDGWKHLVELSLGNDGEALNGSKAIHEVATERNGLPGQRKRTGCRDPFYYRTTPYLFFQLTPHAQDEQYSLRTIQSLVDAADRTAALSRLERTGSPLGRRCVSPCSPPSLDSGRRERIVLLCSERLMTCTRSLRE